MRNPQAKVPGIVRLEEASESALVAFLAVRDNRFWGQPFTEPTTCR